MQHEWINVCQQWQPAPGYHPAKFGGSPLHVAAKELQNLKKNAGWSMILLSPWPDNWMIELGWRYHPRDASSPGDGTLRANLGISSDLIYHWFQTITSLLAHLHGMARHRWVLGRAWGDSSDGKANSCRRGAPTLAYFPQVSIQQAWTDVRTSSWNNPTAQFQLCLASGRLICRHSVRKKAPDPSIWYCQDAKHRMESTGCKTWGREKVKEGSQHLQEFHIQPSTHPWLVGL